MVHLETLMKRQPEGIKDITVSKCQVDSSPRCQNAEEINNQNILMSEMGDNILRTAENKENIVSEALLPDVQTFVSKSLKHCHPRTDTLRETVSESQTFLGKLNDCKTIVGDLSRVQELKEQLARAEKSLREQLKFSKDVEIENIPPVTTSFPSAESTITIDSINQDHERDFFPKVLQELKTNICEENNSPVPLDLSVKSNLIKENINIVVEQTPDKNPSTKTWETPGKLQVQLTPLITKQIQDLTLTETTSFSCDSKEAAQSCNLNIAITETTNLDVEGSNSTSKSPCSLTQLTHNSNKSSFNSRDTHMKILSPIAEKLNSQSTCDVLGENCNLFRPPIWTPLALKSFGAINSPRPGDVEPEVLSHGASMVVHASRCQSNDDSHSSLSSTSPLPSASCINQSADSEDGKIGRHLALCGSLMTQTPCLSSPDNSAAILPTYQNLSSPTLHKSGQDTVPGHNLPHLAKDGHNDSSRTQDNFFDCTSTVFPMPTVLQAIVPVQTDCQQNCLTDRIFSSESAKTYHQPRTFQGHLKQFQGQSSLQSRTAQRPQSESPKPVSTTGGVTTNQRRLSDNNKDNVRVDTRRHLTPPHGEVGSLSLRGNILQRHRPAARVGPNSHSQRRIASRLQDSQQMFLETLLDEECALFTCCRPLSLHSDSPNRCPNPVAQVLSQGDTMHFLPISDDYHGEHGHLEGSAFGSYTPIHTRSVTRPS